MPRLRILTMRNNRVTSLPESTFRNLRSNIAVLDLDGNPLECTCNMMWYRSWLQESDALPGPRCGNGKMLRELPLSRSDCEIYERNNQLSMPLTNEHGDLFARQSLDEGGPCESEPFEELKSGLPPPEESEYFDQSVDYPSTNDTSELGSLDEPPPPPKSPFSDLPPPPNNVGKNFNHSNTLLNLNQPARPHHPQEQPFSIFGIPIPTFGQLFGQGRQSNGRATSSRGRGRVQLYRNDDPELLKLLNKNQVQVGVGSARPSVANHPNGLQNRPLFQTPFHEPSTVQKGGFTPLLPGEGGFRPMENDTNLDPPRNETGSEIDENRFQEVVTVAQAEKPRIIISNKNEMIGSGEKFFEDETDQKIELGSPIDLPHDEIPPKEHDPPVTDEQTDVHQPIPSELELDYYEKDLEVPREKPSDKEVNWDITNSNRDPQRNELLSALVAPGAQQGVYRTPPGRSTITKVFTPSPGAPAVEQSTTNAPVVPSPEEYYRADPPYASSTEIHRPDSSSNASPDWYFESYNKTPDPPKMYPKRSFHHPATSATDSTHGRHHLHLLATSASLLTLNLLRNLWCI